MGTRKDLSCHACNLMIMIMIMIMICNPDNHDYQQMLCSSGKSYQHWRKYLCRKFFLLWYIFQFESQLASWPGSWDCFTKPPNTFTARANPQFFACQGFFSTKKHQKFCRWSLDVKDGVALLRAGLHWFRFILTCGACSFKSYPLICLTFGRDDVRAQTLVLLIVPEIVNGEADG